MGYHVYLVWAEALRVPGAAFFRWDMQGNPERTLRLGMTGDAERASRLAHDVAARLGVPIKERWLCGVRPDLKG